MGRLGRVGWPVHGGWPLAAACLLAVIASPARVFAQPAPPAATNEAIVERLDEQEAEIQRLQARLNELQPATADDSLSLPVTSGGDGAIVCDGLQSASLTSAHEKD